MLYNMVVHGQVTKITGNSNSKTTLAMKAQVIRWMLWLICQTSKKQWQQIC